MEGKREGVGGGCAENTEPNLSQQCDRIGSIKQQTDALSADRESVGTQLRHIRGAIAQVDDMLQAARAAAMPIEPPSAQVD